MLHGYPHPAKAQLLPKAAQQADREKRSDMASIYNEIKTPSYANGSQWNRLLGSKIPRTSFHGVVHNLKFTIMQSIIDNRFKE
jgi:hypothetical protein